MLCTLFLDGSEKSWDHLLISWLTPGFILDKLEEQGYSHFNFCCFIAQQQFDQLIFYHIGGHGAKDFPAGTLPLRIPCIDIAECRPDHRKSKGANHRKYILGSVGYKWIITCDQITHRIYHFVTYR